TEELLPTDTLVACQEAVDEQNNVVHNGQRDVSTTYATRRPARYCNRREPAGKAQKLRAGWDHPTRPSVVSASRQAPAGFSQLIIQGTPKRSVSMPKRTQLKVSPIGIWTVPPSDRAANRRSASAGVSTCTTTSQPLIPSYGMSGWASQPISTWSPRTMRACMILAPVLAGMCSLA